MPSEHGRGSRGTGKAGRPPGGIARRATAGTAVALIAAVALAASPALAAGWTVVPIPPSGRDAFVLNVSADGHSGAWAVGFTSTEGGG